MKLQHALQSGLAGAIALTILHETARHVVPHAPRMDVIGMRAIARSLRGLDQSPPQGNILYGTAMLGDLLSNTLYYSLIGAGNAGYAWRRGVILGLLAGLGGAFLPKPLGLGRQPQERAPATHAMTIAWYTLGGLVAAAIARRAASRC